ncbi:hypothetical protein ACFLYB_05130 [Chloroflexota bacterium]
MNNGRLLGIVLAIVLFVGILSCSNAGDNVSITTTTLIFSLIPHEPGETPMVPHPKQLFKECNLCHIEALNVGSSIKISIEHSCEECHLNLDYNGACQETSPVNITCNIDICHQYP